MRIRSAGLRWPAKTQESKKCCLTRHVTPVFGGRRAEGLQRLKQIFRGKCKAEGERRK